MAVIDFDHRPFLRQRSFPNSFPVNLANHIIRQAPNIYLITGLSLHSEENFLFHCFHFIAIDIESSSPNMELVENFRKHLQEYYVDIPN